MFVFLETQYHNGLCVFENLLSSMGSSFLDFGHTSSFKTFSGKFATMARWF